MASQSSSIGSSKEHGSSGFEFVAMGVKVKDKPVSEDEMKEIKVGKTDSSPENPSTLNMSSSTISCKLSESSHVVKKKEEMEESVDPIDFPSCPLFENEDFSTEAFCQAEMNEDGNGYSTEVPLKVRSQFASHVPSVPVNEIRSKSFPCPECALMFQTQLRLKKHLGLMHGKPFLCLHCPTAFVKSGELTMHMISHSVARVFSCTQCRAEFKDKESLNEHLPTHARDSSQPSGSSFWCRNCDARFATEQLLAKHVIKHKNDRLFPCVFCPSKFKLKAHLVRHLKFHTDESLISCPHCLMKFKTERTFKLHSCNRTTGKIFPCTFCRAEFKFRSGLISHLACHSDERPFPCAVCTLAFKTKDGLKKHTMRYHVQANKKAFACEHCPASYKHKEELSQHLKLHVDGKPFQCSFCSSTFTAKNSLKVHIVAKHFSCIHCAEMFKTEAEVMDHLTTCSKGNVLMSPENS